MAKLLRRRRARGEHEGDGVAGRARVDKRTKRLVTRLEPGEIAVIDHEDLDRVSAEALVQRRVAAVVNAARSSSGRYPNLGPLLLCSAGIPLVDDAGPDVMNIAEGTRLVIDGDHVFSVNGNGRKQVARGKAISLQRAEEMLDDTKKSIADTLERFAENTIEYIKDERDLLLEGVRVPGVKTDFAGRHVLIVVRGYDYKEDLAILRSYIRDVKPILVGVDGGADALLDAGLKPDIIVGDMDSVSTEALVSGSEIVVHAYPGGRAPGYERIRALEIPATVFEAPGTSEDIAMLLAFEKGAELMVAVGTHANLVEFMDKGRKGMASTFLTRLRVGPILVDAKGVSKLYGTRIRRSDVFMLIGGTLVALAVAIFTSPATNRLVDILIIRLQNLWFALRQALF